MERQSRPSQQLAPMSGGVPQGLRYGSGASDNIPATRHLSVFTAENQSVFTPGIPAVRIPVSSKTFLDQKNARLCFDLKKHHCDRPGALGWCYTMLDPAIVRPFSAGRRTRAH
jgi:hypothetical protein